MLFALDDDELVLEGESEGEGRERSTVSLRRPRLPRWESLPSCSDSNLPNPGSCGAGVLSDADSLGVAGATTEADDDEASRPVVELLVETDEEEVRTSSGGRR